MRLSSASLGLPSLLLSSFDFGEVRRSEHQENISYVTWVALPHVSQPANQWKPNLADCKSILYFLVIN